MTNEGWPEEQRPELYDPLGQPDDELNELVAKVAGMATERAYTALVEGTDAVDVASEIITQAGMHSAIGYPTRAVEELRLFEAMQLPETHETASTYASYRNVRISMMLRSGVDYADETLRGVLHEQETSPVQTPETSARIYYRLAMHGDAASFRKWLDPTLKSMLLSDAETSEHNPYPEYEPHHDLATLLIQNVFAIQQADEAKTMASAFEARGMLMVFLDSVRQNLATSPRKALLAERMGRYVGRIQDVPDPDVRMQATELKFSLIEQGVESPLDRNEKHITDCRLHKQLIRRLLGMTMRPGPEQERARTLLDRWDGEGLFMERDFIKISRWREELRRQNASRRGRRRR